MTLQHVTDDLAAKALAKPGITHSLGLKRGLRLSLRYRREHYTLSLSRLGVYPSVAEKAILRRCFEIPGDRKWRTSTRQQWKIWYIFWNPDNARPDGPAPKPAQRYLPAMPLREITNPIQLRAAAKRAAQAVGPAAARAVNPGGPT